MNDSKQVILMASYNEWMNAKVFSPSDHHSKPRQHADPDSAG
jgi:hypothetical protein